ncbi:MAG: metallophosphoesterase [Planctomycetaceae bacterium]
MPRLVWLTDIHLDAADARRIELLAHDVRAAAADAVLIGGDIALAPTFAAALRDLATRFQTPVYFVLGNHDYYRGAIAEVRAAARELSRSEENVVWLPEAMVVPLGHETALVGHGGWGDARLGDFAGSTVVLNDYLLIEELRRVARRPVGGRQSAGGSRQAANHGNDPQRDAIESERFHEPFGIPTVPLPDALRVKLNELGDDAAAHFRDALARVPAERSHLLVLTHVPPWREACWYEGRTSDDEWAPHFTCGAVGEVLRDHMRRHPEKRMTVLCGHTHNAGEADILPNLHVVTGAAEYGAPRVQRVIEVE